MRKLFILLSLVVLQTDAKTPFAPVADADCDADCTCNYMTETEEDYIACMSGDYDYEPPSDGEWDDCMNATGEYDDPPPLEVNSEKNDGADLFVKDAEGRTSLHLAAMYGYREMVAIILKHNPTVNVKDHEGNTPLHYAIMRGQKSVAYMLMEAGADMDVKNNKGEPALVVLELEGKAVCWHVCSISEYHCEGNEDREPEMFYEKSLYIQLQSAFRKGFETVEHDKECKPYWEGDDGESIAFIYENMAGLQKRNPNKAAKIVQKKGTSVKITLWKTN